MAGGDLYGGVGVLFGHTQVPEWMVAFSGRDESSMASGLPHPMFALMMWWALVGLVTRRLWLPKWSFKAERWDD